MGRGALLILAPALLVSLAFAGERAGVSSSMEKGLRVATPVLVAAVAALVGGVAALMGGVAALVGGVVALVVVGVEKGLLELTRRALVCGGGVGGSAPTASSATVSAKDSKKEGCREGLGGGTRDAGES